MTCSNCTALRDRVRVLERELGLRIRDGEIGALMSRLDVTPIEARVLSALYGAKGRFLTKDRLLEEAGIASESSLKTWICHLRKKVGENAITTAHGEGYALTVRGCAMVLASVQPPELQDVR